VKYSIVQRNKIIYEVNGLVKVKKYNFNGIKLYLNKYTLIPHPDTFQLIQIAIDVLKRNRRIKVIADVGTGSGVIAIFLAKKFPSKTFIASDISMEALDLAKKSSALNKLKNVIFLQNTNNIWLSEYKNMKIDFVISNPPFVGENEFNDTKFLQAYPEVKLEPLSAIITSGDKYGWNPYLQIIKNTNKLYILSWLFQCNSENIKFLLTKIPKIAKTKISVIKDINGFDRFLLIHKY